MLVQRLEVLGPGPAMELDDAVEAIDKAREEEKATASDVGVASKAVDELDDGAFVAVRGGRARGLSMRSRIQEGRAERLGLHSI